MIPPTTARVPAHTAEQVNQWIREQTRANVERYSRAGPAALDQRLRELNEEWDIERTLEANAATVAAAGAALALLVDRRFAILPLVVGGFLLQHAVQGWCPPLPVFRRLGVRTQTEIEAEKAALKAVRGDFQNAVGRPDRALEAARG